MSEKIVKDLNHVGLIVPDVDKACALFTLLGFECSEPVQLVPFLKIRFAKTANADLEIIQPLTEDCDHGKWLKEHPQGGIHHICFHTPTLPEGIEAMKKLGIRTCTDEPLKLQNGKDVQFFNPEDTFGILMELADWY